LLGKGEITAKDLFENDGQAELPLVLNGEETGAYVTVSAEMFHLSKHTTSLSLPEFDGKRNLCGLLTIIVTKAFDVPLPKEGKFCSLLAFEYKYSLTSGSVFQDCATMVKVVFGKSHPHQETFWTGTVADYPGIDAQNPMFDVVFHVPITSAMLEAEEAGAAAMQVSQAGPNGSPPKSSPGSKRSIRNSVVGMISRSSELKGSNFIEMTLIDGDGANGTKGHGELGTISISRRELMNAQDHTITETRAIGEGGAKLEFKIMLSGIQSEEESDVSDIDASEKDILDSINGTVEGGQTVMLTALRGRGFPIHKRRALKKDDVPDIYLAVPQLSWKTSVVKDDTMPQWNESKLFTAVNIGRKLRVDAYDKNSKSKDDYIGTAKFSLEQLLRKRTMEMELMNGSERTNSFVTMQCVLRSTQGSGESSDVLGPLLSAFAPASFSPFNLELDTGMGMNGDDQSMTSQTDGSNFSTSSSRRKLLRGISSSLPSPKSFAKSFRRNKSTRNALNGSVTEASVTE
jgi:hypothetical protein